MTNLQNKASEKPANAEEQAAFGQKDFSAPLCLEKPAPALDVAINFTRPGAQELYLELGGKPFPLAATPFSAGMDLRACLEKVPISIGPGERLAVGCGFGIQIKSPGWAAFVYSRSGLGAREGLVVAQGVGLIDPDYTGEILIYLLNTSKHERPLSLGERVAQLVFQPFAMPVWQEVQSFCPTERGTGAFGHSGI